MKDKQWLWALLGAVPVTLYLMELFFGEAELTAQSLIAYFLSSALGVVLGYFLYTRGLVKLNTLKGSQLIIFIVIILAAIVFSVLLDETGLSDTQMMISWIAVLSLSSSAIALTFGRLDDRKV